MSEEQKLAKALEQFCYRTLKERTAVGGAKNYRTILQQLTTTTDHAALARWLTALSKCVSLINPEHHSPCHELVKVIFSVELFELPVSTLQAYFHLLERLASANTAFVRSCFGVWASAFSRASVGGPDQSNEEAAVQQDNKGAATVRELHDLEHTSLQKVVRMVPSSPTILFPVLMDNFPHKLRDTETQQMYVKNLLRISEYTPNLRDRIVAAIVERLIQIDVEIVVDGRNKRVSTGGETALFSFENDSDEDDREPAVEGQSTLNSPMAEKLDSLMCMICEYIKLLCSSNDHTLADRTFSAMLEVFEKAILRTHKSRFTQYLIFVFCGNSHSHTETFLMRLLQKAFDNDAPMGDRVNSAFYLSSFVVRAAFLRQVAAITAFDFLVKWLHSYIQQHEQQQGHEGKVGLEGASEHIIFYAITQAVFYIFCFRESTFSTLLRQSPEAIEKYRFDSIINSLLNPLRHCSQRTVRDFTRLMAHLKLVDCQTILAENTRLTNAERHIKEYVMYTETSGSLERDFHPFDPYLLPNSLSYIENSELYINFSDGPWRMDEKDASQTSDSSQFVSPRPSPNFGGQSEDDPHGDSLKNRYNAELSPLMTPMYMAQSPMLSPSMDGFQLNAYRESLDNFSLNDASPTPSSLQLPIPISATRQLSTSSEEEVPSVSMSLEATR